MTQQPQIRIIALLIFILNVNLIFGQSNTRFEDSVHIYWHKDLILKKSDFKFDGRKEENAELYCEKIGLCTCAASNINIIIDIPKEKKKRKKLLEKIYIVPVMEKTKSYTFDKDPIGYQREKLVFDIHEWTARYARQQLEKTISHFKQKYGSIITWHTLILNEAAGKRKNIIESLTKDCYLIPKENGYEIWREKVDIMLKELEAFATKPEDCFRFIQQKPFDENYEQFILLGDEHD